MGFASRSGLTMDAELYALHIAAGTKAGQDKTCGSKVRYPSEESATRASVSMNRKASTRKELEPYPCGFCGHWHIGRKMTLEELRASV